jgi:hypothetical protein
MTTEPTHRYHKDDPIWWNIAISKSRPSWITKGRDQEACWVKEVNYEAGLASIYVMTEERKYEQYVVPLEQIRPRVLP